MSLQLPNKWLWDFWLAQDGPDYHLFYLQSPQQPYQVFRHFNVSVGHAVSQDLINWKVLPDALAPSWGVPHVWDNYTTWTGSVFRHDGRWYMFYTGAMMEERAIIQRIGVAVSSDLIHWEKHPGNPIVVADPKWYELLDLTQWHDQAWRDPWVFEHDGKFHMLVTARVKEGPGHARGVIGHCYSDDLIHWTVAEPVSAPGEFGHLEVPQWVEIEGRWYVFFCTGHNAYSEARRARGVELVTGTHYLVGDAPLGPFKLLTDEFLYADPLGTYYAGKVIRDPKGNWVLMTSHSHAPEDRFVGQLANPVPIKVEADGRLSVVSRF